MKKAVFLNKELNKFLVTSSCPGVYGFINFIEKKVWLSYSENVTEALARNIKLVETRQHIIKNLEHWDICVFEKSDSKQEAKNNFRLYCQSYHKKGLQVLNREFKYKVWGVIEEDFRDKSKFLYYIWIGTKTKKQAVLGIFEKATDGERYLKEFKAGKPTEFPPSSKRLVLEYKNTDLNQKEFKQIFKL